MVAGLDGDVDAVGPEIPREFSSGNLIDDGVDRNALPQFDNVLDRGFPAAVFHLGVHFRPVIAQVLQVPGDVGTGTLHQGGIEYDGLLAEILPEGVDALPAAVGPVVDAQERVPAEDEIGVRLLAYVLGDFLGGNLLLALERHLVGGQTVRALRQQFCSTA